jgi:hypothetical protein
MAMASNFLTNLFRDPTDVYLTKPMKKKKRKLVRVTYGLYALFSMLFLSQVFIALAYKFSLFEIEETQEVKISGWILLIMILFIYFWGRKILAKLKKVTESTRSVWMDQVFVIVPLLILLAVTAFIHIRIGEVIYVISHILTARIIWSPIHVLYLRSNRKLELFNKNLEKHMEKSSQSDFEKEFGIPQR